MVPFRILQRCVLLAWWGMLCWAYTTGVITPDPAAAAKPARIMVLFKAGSQASAQVAEQVLVRALQQRGYHVLDHHILTSPFRREGDPLARFPQPTAQQLGARLGADIVISGYAQVQIQEKTYSTLDGKKVTIGQADVGVRAIIVRTGRVLLADHARARKPFDAAGTGAVEQAAGTLAEKLLAGLEQVYAHNSTDDPCVVLHSAHP